MINELYTYLLLACLFIGPTQVIGGLIRLGNAKHNSEYTKGLNTYFKMVMGYFISYIMVFIIENVGVNIDALLILYMPILPLSIAIYYWKVIYFYSRIELE